MTSTRATLGTLVQCRSMWFWHLIGGTLCLIALIRPLTSTGAREAVVFGVLVVPIPAVRERLTPDSHHLAYPQPEFPIQAQS